MHKLNDLIILMKHVFLFGTAFQKSMLTTHMYHEAAQALQLQPAQLALVVLAISHIFRSLHVLIHCENLVPVMKATQVQLEVLPLCKALVAHLTLNIVLESFRYHICVESIPWHHLVSQLQVVQQPLTLFEPKAFLAEGARKLGEASSVCYP